MKPVFNRPPLTANDTAMLSPGRIRPEGWLGDGAKNALSALRSAERAVRESAIDLKTCEFYRDLGLLSATLGDEDGLSCTAEFIERLKATRKENGFFGPEDGCDLSAQFECLDLLLEYFACTTDRSALEMIDGFLRWEYLNLKKRPLNGFSAYRSGENIYVALKMYDLSGQKYLLELCALLRGQSFDWVSEFNTFPQIRSMSEAMPWKDLEKGLKQETERGKGRYTELLMRTHGVNVAMALKTPSLLGLIRPGFRETQAFSVGWSKLLRLHGTPNGVFSCDELLDGARDAGTLTNAAAETLWSLAVLEEIDETNREIPSAFEKIACNLLPAMFSGDGKAAQRLQTSNQTRIVTGKENYYNGPESGNSFVSVDSDPFALNGIARMWAYAARGLWYQTSDGGLKAASYFPCVLAAVTDGVRIRVRVDGGYPFSDEVTIGISAEKETEFPLYLRVPPWAENPVICLPGGEIMAVKAGETTCLRQKWDKRSLVRLVLNTRARARTLPGGLMGIMYGPVLMALEPAQGEDASKLRLTEDAPTKTVNDTGSWRDFKTLVKLRDETNQQVTRTLTAYAFTEKRICAFVQAKTEEHDA
ncbi:MAG: glycoside hydrolase family 127 protein [Clostridiales bacterium]|nr:glycoside hydrolase family 127 protein [Clostridiales bacterium]